MQHDQVFSAYRTMSESNMLQPWIVSNTCQRTCLGCKRLPYVYRNLSRQRFWWNVVFVEVKKMWTSKHPFLHVYLLFLFCQRTATYPALTTILLRLSIPQYLCDSLVSPSLCGFYTRCAAKAYRGEERTRLILQCVPEWRAGITNRGTSPRCRLFSVLA